jgi:hypothetical protein
MRYYLLSNDDRFANQMQLVLDTSLNNLAAWGISPDELDWSVELTAFQAALAVAKNPATRTSVAVETKNNARKAVVAKARPFIQGRLMKNPRVTPADLLAMELPVHDTHPTPSPTPVRMPIGEIDFSVHQQHTVHVKDDHLTGKVRPDHVRGYEVWRKIGGDTPPATDEEYSYVGFSSRVMFTINYSLSDVGKIVWYRFRWINTRNQPGPWSETPISAIIP